MTLTTPKFIAENIDPALLGEGLGDAFQRLLGELMDVERFQTRGRDGAIDLSDTLGADRTVYEGKTSEIADFDKAENSWKSVFKHLEKNLATPGGPPKGNAQYSPWHRKYPAICTYAFCLNAGCNQSRADMLRDKIQTDLNTLIKKHKHLYHLKGIDVEVWHWDRITKFLERSPDLLYRWFPATRPRTLMPLDWSPRKSNKTIRSYLNTAELSYYALEEHMETHPAPSSILTEKALLDRLSPDGSSGILVIGSGGFGKTRLIFELGLLGTDARPNSCLVGC